MTKCACPEQDCPNKAHPKGGPCATEPPVIRGREILAGWTGSGINRRCPMCRPRVTTALRRAERKAEEVQKRVSAHGRNTQGENHGRKIIQGEIPSQVQTTPF